MEQMEEIGRAQCTHTPISDLPIFVRQTFTQGRFRGFSDLRQAPGGDEGQFLIGKELGQFSNCGGTVRAQHFESSDALQLTLDG